MKFHERSKWIENNFTPILLESFVSNQYLECGWNDYVSVTLKDEAHLNTFNDRIIHKNKKFLNGVDHNKKIYNFSKMCFNNHFGLIRHGKG